MVVLCKISDMNLGEANSLTKSAMNKTSKIDLAKVQLWKHQHKIQNAEL